MDIIENGVERKLFAEVEEVYGEHLCTERLDTPGFIKATNYHQDINELGFEKYPNKLWVTYCGFMLKGVVIADKASDVAEVSTIWEAESYGHSIHMESHSWRKLNKANILIDGIEYSSNGRGANIVIIDAETFEVIDSVVYDTHDPQDYFRRIKSV